MLMSTLLNAISGMVNTFEPQFLSMGRNMFIAFATIALVWHGLKMMYEGDAFGSQMFSFVQLILFLTFGYTLMFFYETPIPVIGFSFSNLISDQAYQLARILDARTIESINAHLDQLRNSFLEPDFWVILPNLIYAGVWIFITIAQAVAFLIVALSLVAGNIAGMVGPIFVPFFIVPKLDFLFWNWLKAFIEFNFLQVVAFAHLRLFENFLSRYLLTVPEAIPDEQIYVYGTGAVVMMAIFIIATIAVPFINHGIFAGGGALSLPNLGRAIGSRGGGGGRAAAAA